MIEIEIPAAWAYGSAALIAGAGLALGFLSALAPKRSIALYVWIMARFNWRVSPADERKELRNTRILGLVLLATSLAAGLRLLSLGPLVR